MNGKCDNCPALDHTIPACQLKYKIEQVGIRSTGGMQYSPANGCDKPKSVKELVDRMIAKEAASALRAIPSEARAQASRDNGKKGGRPKKCICKSLGWDPVLENQTGDYHVLGCPMHTRNQPK